MKKVLLVLLILTCAYSLCFAQETTTTSPAAKETTQVTIDTKTLTGKVESITLADPVKGTKSEIGVVEDNGNKSTILVKSTTTIYDIDWKAISLDAIKKDDRIKARYLTTKEGVNEAVSINIMKQ